jgi:hypothetical protein
MIPVTVVKIRAMAKRKCIFCGGSGPLTREHVFGDWFRKLVGIEDPRPASVTHHVPGSAVEHDFEEIPSARTARVVCADCNNGWMASLEEQAAIILTPLLQGQSGTLSEADLEILALWAFKTAFVLDAASPGAGASFPAEDRHALRESGALPAKSAVWMTTWPGTTTIWTFHWGIPLRDGEDDDADAPNTYGATFALGPIAFRVYATTVEAVDPEFFHDAVPGIFKISPDAGPLEWQAEFWLTADQLKEWAVAIPRLIETNASNGDASAAFWNGEDSAPIRGPE